MGMVGEGESVRVAVVGGAGFWGRYYLQAFCRHPGCEVVALVDQARDRRRLFAEHYRIPRQFDRTEDLLRSEVPDIVATILPVSASHDAVIACAEDGVRVIGCEKPIAESLLKADRMVAVCREGGIALHCGTALYEYPHLREIARWASDGNIGVPTRAAIPAGFPNQVSGAGCVPLSMLRFLTGIEIEWVQGWTVPEDAASSEDDCGAYGLLGLCGGIVREVPAAIEQPTTPVMLAGTEGSVWLAHPHPVFVRGVGSRAPGASLVRLGTDTGAVPPVLLARGRGHGAGSTDRRRGRVSRPRLPASP